MFPTYDQIERAAYARWERRGGVHGQDCDDWYAAEQELLFALNYEVAAFHRLDDPTRRFVGSKGRRVCRFCERAAPDTTFPAEGCPALPESLGNTSLWTYEECDECHAQFAPGIEAELGRFLQAIRLGSRPSASIAARKGLARVALSIMPAREIQSFEDTVEWVVNPDHGFDGRLLGDPGRDLHLLPPPCPRPWVALARRIDDDAAVPYMLVYLGTAERVVEAPVPLCVRDEDLEGEAAVVPRTCPPIAGRPESEPERRDPVGPAPRSNGVAREAPAVA